MKVSELGEFGLIGLIEETIRGTGRTNTASARNLIVGLGDDTAAWQTEPGIELATTDTMVEGVHFDLSFTGWEELGWKAVASNLSDIAAMGGVPRFALVSLAIPGETESEDITQLYRGMVRIANRFGLTIAGGNVARAEKVILTIAISGIAQGRTVLMRSAARAGDSIALTGYTGLSAAGLKLIGDESAGENGSGEILKCAHLMPVPRLNEARVLIKCGVKAAIDISDGLVSDLSHICRASRVGATIKENLVPIHPSLKERFAAESLELALTGGEDYELLFTAPDETIARVSEKLSCPVAVIGRISEGPPGQVTVYTVGGTATHGWRGWDHFKGRVQSLL